MAKRNLPIGIEFYKKVIDEAYFYVDKTLIIKELLDRQSYVNLFTRPRRFGKTLALDMLKTFFEDEIDEKGNAVDNSRYFADKKIMDAGNQYIQHMGRYPVIYLSFKSSKQADWDTTFWMIKKQIAEEYIRHQYVLQTDDLLEVEKNLYRNIMSLADDNKIYVDAISFLSKCLERYHHQKVVILIDEYDVPLENAYFAGFYDEMTVFIRSLMESALKTNESLKLAVITGCLRISKESIFTGLNNLNVISVISDSFAEYFGFTESEVADMLEYYELEDKAEDIKKWYDGYTIGNTEGIYNPWSILNYLKRRELMPYWVNTSSNDLIKLILKNSVTVKEKIEQLLRDEEIEVPINLDTVIVGIEQNEENIWGLLLGTGYLKVTEVVDLAHGIYKVKIPNYEIKFLFQNIIREWFNDKVIGNNLNTILKDLVTLKLDEFEKKFKVLVTQMFSYMDVGENTAENFYHAFVLGMLVGLKDSYYVKSNRESGYGRYDIMLEPKDKNGNSFIMEFKVLENEEEKTIEETIENAKKQIEERKYEEDLQERGYTNITKMVFAFKGKEVKMQVI